MSQSKCDRCERTTVTTVSVPFCKYSPNGLLSDSMNHPATESGDIECTEKCNPQEMTYDKFIEKVGNGKLPAQKFLRCSICGSAKQD